MAKLASDLTDDQSYDEYLQRVACQFGARLPGSYVKFRSRLIRVLNETEFERAHVEYRTVRGKYVHMLQTGQTVNDALVQVLNERGADLLLDG